MAISENPNKNNKQEPMSFEKAVREFEAIFRERINANKSNNSGALNRSVTEKQVSLRMSSDMLNAIDHQVKHRPIRIPRHTWILEAIAEKLKRERSGQP